MKYTFGFCALIFVGMAGWQLGGRLSTDAVAMALGLLFGVMATVPILLLAFVSDRHEYSEPQRRQYTTIPASEEVPLIEQRTYKVIEQ